MNFSNVTTPRDSVTCDLRINPWCGQFGFQQYFEVFFLSLIVILGVSGNLLVIFSILLAGKVNRHGNIFIINLAVADFIVTGIYTPTVIMNVIAMGPGLSPAVCQAFGYIIIAACASSMWNLACIAWNRYWAVAKRPLYVKYFTHRNVVVLIIFVWVWSNLLILPALLGWSHLTYDYKSMVCAWDDGDSIGYSVLMIMGAILIPLGSTVYCYIRLFIYVRNKRRKLTLQRRSPSRSELDVNGRRINHQVSLIKTLVTAVALFVLCWTPYSIIVLFVRENVNPLTEKICTWLGLCNSTVNFIIYGVLNRGFRDGYKRLLASIFFMARLEKPKYFSRQTSVMSRV